MFGPHLTLDLYQCNRKKLSDKNFILSFLEELADVIEMRKIAPAQVVEYPGNPNSFDAGGISAFVLIAESHISIHTFVKQAFASVDIFSCKDFDLKKAEAFVVERLEPKKVEKHFITRGKEFPKDVKKASKIVAKERRKIISS
ncbi:MAG: adenosylmethionine decarboxylase [Candidatus Aenigmatarchaeota archaeon]